MREVRKMSRIERLINIEDRLNRIIDQIHFIEVYVRESEIKVSFFREGLISTFHYIQWQKKLRSCREELMIKVWNPETKLGKDLVEIEIKNADFE
jgi:hypothetical protein